MAELVRLTNPIWWIQVRLMGGWKRIVGFCCAYPALLLACTLVYRRMEPRATMTSLSSDLLHALSILQWAILVLGGCSAISKAISRDVQTKMIESHRLSAMDALGTMWGYVLGPNIMMLLLWALGVLYGSILCGLGGFGPQDWLAGNGLLLLSCLSLWSLVVLLGISAKKQTNVAAGVIGLTLLGPFWVIFFPGAGLLLGAYPVLTAYRLMNTRSGVVEVGISIMMVTCVVMIFTWIMAAKRKYRHPQICAFSPVAGLGLLLIWLVLSLPGIHHFGSLGASFPGTGEMGQVHFIAAMLIALFIGMLPLHSLASAEILRVRAREIARRNDAMSPILYPILVVVLICGILGVMDVPDWDNRTSLYLANLLDAELSQWAATALALLCGLLAIGGMLRFAHATGQKAITLCILFVVIIWVVPIGGDALWANWKHQLDRRSTVLPFSWIFGASPPGTILAAWTDIRIAFWPGLFVQAVIAASLQWLGYRGMGRERRRRLAGDA